jgi:hypothetical protein
MAYRSAYQARRDKAVQSGIEGRGTPPEGSLPQFREIVGCFEKNQTYTLVLLQLGIHIPLFHQII